MELLFLLIHVLTTLYCTDQIRVHVLPDLLFPFRAGPRQGADPLSGQVPQGAPQDGNAGLLPQHVKRHNNPG